MPYDRPSIRVYFRERERGLLERVKGREKGGGRQEERKREKQSLQRGRPGTHGDREKERLKRGRESWGRSS